MQGTGIREQGLGLVAMLGLLCCGALGQTINLGDARSAAHKGHVELVSDSVEVEAGKPEMVELRFRVDPGFHINSHTPKDELLIPTELKLDVGSGPKVTGEEYQKGSTFRLTAGSGSGPGALLDVYQGEFSVNVRVTVPKGPSVLVGMLHYQACDNQACFPPRTLQVMVAVKGK
jgi:hypothetical protein